MNFQVAFDQLNAFKRAEFSQGVLAFTSKPSTNNNINLRPLNPADPLQVIIKQE